MPSNTHDYTRIPSTGILPDDLVPADQISFGYVFAYEVEADFTRIAFPPIVGHIVLELKDDAGNLKATFDLQETYTVTILTPPATDGLAFYTWAWDINAEKFTAMDDQGQPLTTEGKFSLGSVPGGYDDYGTHTARIEATFYSYVFNCDVDEGDTLKIKFHNLSAGTVTDKASLLVATRPRDATTPAAVDGRRGQQFRVVLDKQTHVVRSRRLDSPVPLANTEGAPHAGAGSETSGSPATNPGNTSESTDGLVYDGKLAGAQLERAEATTLYVLGTGTGHLLLFRSDNDGKTWKQIMSEPTKLKILAARLARGGRYIVYGVGDDKKAAYAILKHGAGGWTLSESGPCQLAPPTSPTTTSPTPSTPTPTTPSPTVTELPITKVGALEDGEGGVLRLLSTDKDGALRIYLSRDGKTWQQSATT